MVRVFFLMVIGSFLVSASSATVYELEQAPGVEADELFAAYCGDVARISTEIPQPVYSNPLVKAASEKLNTVAPVSFYMYGAVVRNYGFKNSEKLADGTTKYYRDATFPLALYQANIDDYSNQQYGMVDKEDGTQEFSQEKLQHNFDYEYVSDTNPAPAGVKGNTHAFLTYLCGEFRDRPTLIEEKLAWIGSMIKLPTAKQEPIQPDPALKNIWSQLTAESYAYYATFSRNLFNAKEADAWKDGRTMSISPTWSVDKPVPAFKICEVKYILTEYVTKANTAEREFPGLEKYNAGLQSYEVTSCSQEDKDYYYDFRGDSNMKPNSPESNGMIWYATSIMGRCQRDGSGRVSVGNYTNANQEKAPLDFPLEECVKYMKNPFQSRWNAARAGLATWLLRDTKYDLNFSSTYSPVTMVPSFTPELAPMSFRLDDATVLDGSDISHFMPAFGENFTAHWVAPDIGFNTVFGIDGSKVVDIDNAYQRIKDAVDRHTDWYASGYDDTVFEPNKARAIGQAYSPFVASSYEMSESDAFTAPGITVNGPADGRRQFMYVFKVHKDKWYNTTSLAEGKQVNFETQWFDETSFGTTHLADSERAWDRLGTPLEGEMETIIYLHNIERGTPIKSLQPSIYPAIMEDEIN